MHFAPEPEQPRRLIILVQWSADNDVPAHVAVYLRALRPLATRLVLISNSPLNASARGFAETLCDSVIERPNIGLDFAAWRDALAQEDMSSWDHVVLTNSSIIGPLHPLAPIFETMEHREADFWGIVQSNELKPHLQSYFLSFSASVIRSEPWRQFWAGVQDLTDKREIIRRYEVGLTGYLVDHGFTHESLVKPLPFWSSLRMRHVRTLRGLRLPVFTRYSNRAIHSYAELVGAGMPFLKASLVWGSDTWRFGGIDEVKRLSDRQFPWSELEL
ncbi:MAG: rhamnan synthesis F family protein [Pseudomonadota bacterium]